jgi:hypothetical protein
MEELNRKGTEILPYPLQRGVVRNLSIAAEAAADRTFRVGRAKRQSINMHRRIGFLHLPDCGDFANRQARRAVEREPKPEIFEVLTRRNRTMGSPTSLLVRRL